MRRTAFALLAFLLPFGVQAQTGTPTTFRGLVDGIVGFVNTAVLPLLYALALLFFLVGMTRFFFLGGAENREQGKSFMIWGIIGLFVMFSVWGIVNMVLATFGAGR